jgi:hypothetical protein
VAITRAQALLILVGNPDTLCNDPVWYDLLEWIVNNGGCKDLVELGRRPEETVSASLEDLLAGFEALDVKPAPSALKVTAADFF